MMMFTPHTEILPSSQQEIWPKLSPITEMGFVLYGETAIALQLAHRGSTDFDFFSSRLFNNEEFFDLLPFLRESAIKQNGINTLSVRTQNNVKISFFGEISFGRVGEPLVCSETGLQIASLYDLMALKLKALFDHCVCKDYIDISAMIQAGVSVARGLSSAREMFGAEFQPMIALKAMTCFDRGDLNELSKKDRAILITALIKVDVVHSSRIISYEFS